MKKLILVLTIFSFISCESIKFREQVLYQKYETNTARESNYQAIFSNGEGTMWNSLFDCGNFEIDKNITYSGNSSIKLNWNKANCEWIGFGNSFNNWQSADLSKDIYTKALSFYVRTQSNTATAIPIVANLEDFGGGGSYFFIDASKYLYGLEMDTTWKQIIVPLWHFPIDEEEVDISSIKQMKFQLEGAGSFYLDEIKLIDYSKEEYQKMRAEVELMKPKGEFNQTVYRENSFKEDVWGYENNICQTLTQSTSKTGEKYIYWKYDGDECPWAKWGINWNGWYAMNLRGITEKSSIKFKIKTTKKAKFKVFIQDFKGHKAEIFNSKNQNFSMEKWETILIPLKSLNLISKQFALDQIKQIYFEGTGVAEVFISEIKITDK